MSGPRRDGDSRSTPTAPAIRRPRLRLPVSLFALAIFLCGCAGYRTSPVPIGYDSAAAAIRALSATSPGALAVTATTRVAITRDGERYPLKVAMMMQRPALLRVESIPLMGPPDFYLSFASGEIRVFFPGEGKFYVGRATPPNIARFFSVSIPVGDMVSLLMGVPPEDAGESPGTEMSGGKTEDGLYRVDQRQSGRRTCTLWIHPADGRLIRFQRFTPEGKGLYTADFADHARVGQGLLPQQVTIRTEATVLSIRHTDLRQFSVDPAAFPLPEPEGIAPIPLDP